MIERPDAAVLEGLPSARWGALLPVLRSALAAVPSGTASAAAEALRDVPASALGSGSRRRSLCRVVAEDDRVWSEVARRLDPLPEGLAWLEAVVAAARTRTEAPEAPGGREDGERTRDRVRELQQERAELRRRLDGAQARTVTAERRAAESEAERAHLEAERARLADALAAAEAERQRAWERGARRADAEAERLRDELTATRRALAEVTAERDALHVRLDRVEGELGVLRDRAPRPPVRTEGGGLRAGRPSRLPRGVEDGTTEAAELLLHPGRLVLVDGYNLTLRHRGHLDLAQQRAWLVTTLATFVARIPVRPVVVFDGERAGGSRTMPPARGVEVRFTPDGVTADDEIVLAVEATDEPVVVVTDDQELRRRVRALEADVVPTANLLGVVGG